MVESTKFALDTRMLDLERTASSVGIGTLVQDPYITPMKHIDYVISKGELLNNAIKQDNIFVIEKLIESGIETSSRIYFPLEIATKIGNIYVIKLLIKNGALCTSRCFRNALTLDIGTCLAVIQELLQTKISASVKAEALIEASKLGLLSVVKIFIDYGLSVNSYDPFTDFSPVYMAGSHGHFEIVNYLVNKGAILRRNSEMITFVPYPNIMRLFLSLKYDINHAVHQFISAGYVVPNSVDPQMKTEYKKRLNKKFHFRQSARLSLVKIVLRPKSIHIQMMLFI
jgi:ankyrin repeat protein